MLNLRKLCADSHQISKDAGWLDTPRTNDQIVNLFITEISEAFEEDRANKRIDEVYYEVKLNSDGFKGNGTYSVEQLKELRLQAGIEILSAKPCGIPVELADWAIRVAQYVGTENLTEAFVLAYENQDDVMLDENTTFSELCLELTRLSVRSWHSDRNLDVIKLAEGFIILEQFCALNKIALDAAVAEKEAYNKTRAYRHGGKKC